MDFGDAAYRLWLQAPSSSPPAEGFPVLWVLDGAKLFTLVADTVRRLGARPDATGVSPMTVVGVDRATPDDNGRHLDYTPCPSSEPGVAAVHGGAEAFLDRLAGPMRAAVSGFAAAGASHILLGHSLAAYFALYAMGRRPEAFRCFGAISPSVWWDEAVLHAALHGMDDIGQSAFVAVGEREEPATPATPTELRRHRRRMVSRARAAADLAERRLGRGHSQFRLASDEDHASVPPAVLPRFLRFASAATVQPRTP